jgi:Site-specific recombinase XerD
MMQEPKTRSSIRVINVPDMVMNALKEYKSTLPSDAVMVVPQLNSDKPMALRNFSRTFSQWCEKAELETNRVHDLRHTYASQLMALNVPLKLTQAQLGHSDIKTTMRYSHFMDGMQQEAANKLNQKLENIFQQRNDDSDFKK